MTTNTTQPQLHERIQKRVMRSLDYLVDRVWIDALSMLLLFAPLRSGVHNMHNIAVAFAAVVVVTFVVFALIEVVEGDESE